MVIIKQNKFNQMFLKNKFLNSSSIGLKLKSNKFILTLDWMQFILIQKY